MKTSIRPKVILLINLVLIVSACSPSSPIPPSPSTIPPSPTPQATATVSANFQDDFSDKLEPGWSWIKEENTIWDLTTKPGYLSIVLQDQPAPNIIVRAITSENFQIITHVLFTPTSNFQIAGLLVYQDEETLAQFGRAFCDLQNGCVGNGIYFEGAQNKQYIGPNLATETLKKDEAYLRLDKIGSLFTGYYSEDGNNWIVIGEHEFAMLSPKVGLIAGNSFVAGTVAYFDYFIQKELP
jgi:beta-xylosidase